MIDLYIVCMTPYTKILFSEKQMYFNFWENAGMEWGLKCPTVDARPCVCGIVDKMPEWIFQ